MAYKKKGSANINTTAEVVDTNEGVVELLNDIKDEINTEDTQSILNDIQDGLRDVTAMDITVDTKTETVKIKADELIPVRSMVRGGFNWKCKKSGIWYRWPNIGHVELLPYEDLYQLFTNNKHYLTKAFLLIEDERVIGLFKLADIYRDIAIVNRLVGKAVGSVSIMTDICEQAKRIGMRDFLVERLCQMRNNGILTNIDVIATAEKILRCEVSRD